MSDTAAPSSSFPVVAVGGSAGGLAATSELLRELGAEPGLALVIIHHLDPTHASRLVDILARSSSLPVVAARDGVRVEPNHVYVIPPNAGLLIGGGVLRVVPREEAGGIHHPINRFFASLALDRDGLAVGVVLSGTGFDGADGIKAIKREGGITLAQDATAEYGGMPESAIATGCVDFILPPAGLARELRRLATQAPALRAKPQSGAADRDYVQILAAMRRASGVDFASYKPSTIRRRLERRLFFHGLSDLPAYLELLQRDPAEVAALCEEALIHVTGFFREPQAFEALRTSVFPKFCEDRARDAAIRIWVPGCSTGEEVYSLAICVREFLADANRDLPIKIFGTDLSSTIVEKARTGRFSESIEGEVSAGRLQSFFSKIEGGYQIRRDLRDLCVFARHDVTRDPPFAAMDLISCRNLMIYLGVELQNRVIGLLHYALNELGFLLLGSAETVHAFPGFAVVDGKNKIYARTSAAPRMSFDFTAPHLPLDRPAVALSTPGALGPDAGARSIGQSDVSREADRLVLAEFAPPGVVVNDDLAVIHFRGRTGPFLEHAPGVASLDLLHTARQELRLPLRRAIDQARSSERPVRETGVALFADDKRRTIALEVIPFAVHPARQRFFLVLFEDATRDPGSAQEPSVPSERGDAPQESLLGEELASTRQYLESVIERLEATNEELKAANEEVVSSNEELRSTNEELQSAKEELQAINEELRTVNEEMRDRSAEAMRLSDDLTNVLTSIEIPILIVGRNLRLRRFTPAAARLFGLLASDVGRAVSDLPRVVALAPALARNVSDVIEHLRPIDSSIQDGSGRHYVLSVRPYLTLDGRVDGAVVTGRDVEAQTRSAERVEAARAYAQAVVDTVREGLVVLDRELRVTSANKAFLRTFRVSSEEIQGHRLDELGRPEFATPLLPKLLGELDGDEIVEGFRLEQSDPAGGPRALTLNARRIEATQLILLAFEDVTLAEQARAAQNRILAYQDELRRMSFDAAVTEERERRRIASELHDGMGQTLALAQIKLSSVREEIQGEARTAVDGAVELLGQAIVDARTLIFELSPPILYDLGLEEALAWLAEDLEKRHGIKIEVTDDGTTKPLDDTTKGIAFRVVRELLMNVLKHAQAPAAKVAVTRNDDHCRIDVEDRGAGFDPDATLEPGSGGFGLLSARAQIARLGGRLEIQSTPGRGTLASVRVPLQTSAAPLEPSGSGAHAGAEGAPGAEGVP